MKIQLEIKKRCCLVEIPIWSINIFCMPINKKKYPRKSPLGNEKSFITFFRVFIHIYEAIQFIHIHRKKSATMNLLFNNSWTINSIPANCNSILNQQNLFCGKCSREKIDSNNDNWTAFIKYQIGKSQWVCLFSDSKFHEIWEEHFKRNIQIDIFNVTSHSLSDHA